MAKMSTDDLLEAFKEMTLLELSDFVKQFEETFDVKADRKSTRLNSSHMSISYAVFCLKKKIIEPPYTGTADIRSRPGGYERHCPYAASLAVPAAALYLRLPHLSPPRRPATDCADYVRI